MTKAMCIALVAAHCMKATAQAAARKDARIAVQGSVWRGKGLRVQHATLTRRG